MAGLNPNGLGRNRSFDDTESDSLSTDALSNTKYATSFGGSTGGEQIQNALDKAQSEKGTNIVVVDGYGPDDVTNSSGAISDTTLAENAWRVDEPIEYYPNTILKFDGAYVFLADGADDNIIQPADNTTIAPRVTVEGPAIFDGNNVNQTDFDDGGSDADKNVGLLFYNTRRLQLRNFTMRNTMDWGVKPENCSRININSLFFDQNTHASNHDGVHLIGPMEEVNVVNIAGETQDDMIAVNAYDPEMMTGDGGDVCNINISNISRNGLGKGGAVRVWSSSGSESTTTTNVTVSNVTDRGTTDVGAVNIGFSGDSFDKHRNVSVRGVRSKDHRAVQISGSNRGLGIEDIGAINADDVIRVSRSVSAMSINDVAGIDCNNVIKIGGTATLSTCTIRGVRGEVLNGVQNSVINVVSGELLQGVTISDVSFYDDNTNVTVFDFDGDATDLNISNVNARKVDTVFDMTGSVDGQVSGVNVGSGTAYAATSNLRFDPTCPAFDSPPANVTGSMPIATSSWDPDSDGNGEVVIADGANWNEVADMPNI